MIRRLAVLLALGFVAALSPAASPIAAAADPPLAGVVIAIDPGHNGGNATHIAEISRKVWIGNAWKPCNKVGTRTLSGFSEHRLNWLVALRVKARLEALGATVHLTRDSDKGWGPCVDARGRLGAAVGADLELSIHGDGAPSAYRGFFVMRPGVVAGWTDDIAVPSARLAKALRAGLLDAGVPMANYYTTTGIKVRSDLGTLNWSDVPIAMVELGNMRNARDAARMTTSTGRERYAIGLVHGIRGFLGR